MPEPQSFQRQVAFKVRVSDILNAKVDDSNIYRVNIIGTIVYKSEEPSTYASAIIDDGSGRISLRSFENNSPISKTEVGDIALIIGKLREFNNERYILPEILKKMSNFGWMNVRKMELNKRGIVGVGERTEMKPEESSESADSYKEVYSTIKKLDNGDGVSIEELLKNCAHPDAEAMVNELLEKGSIFEIRPGRVKVLE